MAATICRALFSLRNEKVPSRFKQSFACSVTLLCALGQTRDRHRSQGHCHHPKLILLRNERI